jgi:hypothetical protein
MSVQETLLVEKITKSMDAGYVNCARCRKEMPYIRQGADRHLTTDLGLMVVLTGEAGEFRDDLKEGMADPGPMILTICHDCAHKLMAWFSIDAIGWHHHPE